MLKRMLAIESLKDLCLGVEKELKTYMPFEQIVVLFYSKDLDSLYNVVVSEDDDVKGNHMNVINTLKLKIKKMKDNIHKVGQEPIDKATAHLAVL